MDTKIFWDWNRETMLMLASMVAGAYVWIFTDKLLLGIAVGIAVEFAFVSVYQTLARQFGWRNLSFVDTFQSRHLPHLAPLFAQTRLAFRRIHQGLVLGYRSITRRASVLR